MIKRGQIYFIKSNRKEQGAEQYANRPAVIVSNNKNNVNSTVYEVVYMTTQPKKDLPTHFIINSALSRSTVLCEQICSIYEERIGEWIGELTPDEIKMLDQCLAISIGLKQEQTEETKILRQRIEELEKGNKEFQEVMLYKKTGGENMRQQLEEVEERQRLAEKQAETYKEMYEFLLSKQLGGK